MSRIGGIFERLARQRRKGLIPFITAGDPAAGATVPVMHALAQAGADVIELGDIPGSPPDLSLPQPGCWFAPRCAFAEPVCLVEEPKLTPLGLGTAACHVRARETGTRLEMALHAE